MKTLLKIVIDKDIEDPMYDLVLQPGFDTDCILTLYVGPNTNIEEALNNKESINKEIDYIKSLFNDIKDFDLSELNHKSLIVSRLAIASKSLNSIFLVAPFNYEIVNDLAREEIKNKLSVSWLK